MLRSLMTVAIVLIAVPSAFAVTVFGPVQYNSTLDIPVGFYTSGLPGFVEDMEDASLDGGLVAPGGSIIMDTASVDIDDGAVDGACSGCHELYNMTSIIYPGAPTAAAFVLTNLSGDVTFDVYGPGDVLLTTFIVGHPFTKGPTDSRFYGFQDAGGIDRVEFSGTTRIIDHVQYGSFSAAAATPEPSTAVLAILGLVGFTTTRRSRRRRG